MGKTTSNITKQYHLRKKITERGPIPTSTANILSNLKSTNFPSATPASELTSYIATYISGFKLSKAQSILLQFLTLISFVYSGWEKYNYVPRGDGSYIKIWFSDNLLGKQHDIDSLMSKITEACQIGTLPSERGSDYELMENIKDLVKIFSTRPPDLDTISCIKRFFEESGIPSFWDTTAGVFTIIGPFLAVILLILMVANKEKISQAIKNLVRNLKSYYLQKTDPQLRRMANLKNEEEKLNREQSSLDENKENIEENIKALRQMLTAAEEELETKKRQHETMVGESFNSDVDVLAEKKMDLDDIKKEIEKLKENREKLQKTLKEHEELLEERGKKWEAIEERIGTIRQEKSEVKEGFRKKLSNDEIPLLELKIEKTELKEDKQEEIEQNEQKEIPLKNNKELKKVGFIDQVEMEEKENQEDDEFKNGAELYLKDNWEEFKQNNNNLDDESENGIKLG